MSQNKLKSAIVSPSPSASLSESNEDENKIMPSQTEMKDILIAKIKTFKNVDIKTKELTNNCGIFHAITVHIKLDDIGYGTFHSATLKTVSYSGRVVNIKCVLTDNDNLIRDMKINRDSVFQCFRDIAPDTITSISLESFKDQSEKDHLRIIASTIKGSSLIYIYKKLMEFVTIINDKYGKLQENDNSTTVILQNQALKNTLANQSSQSSHTSQSTQSSHSSHSSQSHQSTHSTQSSHQLSHQLSNQPSHHVIETNPIEDLDAEERRLQQQIDNIRLLKKAQQYSLGISETTKPEPEVEKPKVDTTTFAYKLMQNVKKNNEVIALPSNELL